jgi:precorrin-6B methylase 2
VLDEVNDVGAGTGTILVDIVVPYMVMTVT